MKISVTFEFSDDDRLAIDSQVHPVPTKATRAQMISWVEKTVRADLEAVRADYSATERSQQ